jgi:hypothetical protein
LRAGLRLLLVVVLLGAIVLEGYYVAVLRKTVERQDEELRNISRELQTLKIERAELKDKLSSVEQMRGEE